MLFDAAILRYYENTRAQLEKERHNKVKNTVAEAFEEYRFALRDFLDSVEQGYYEMYHYESYMVPLNLHYGRVFARQAKLLGISKKQLASYWYHLSTKRVKALIQEAEEREKEQQQQREARSAKRKSPYTSKAIEPIVELSFPWTAGRHLNKLRRCLTRTATV